MPANEIPAVEKEPALQQPVGEAFAPTVLGAGQLPAHEIPLIEKEVGTPEQALDEEPDIQQAESMRERIRAAANPRAFAPQPASYVAEKFVTAEVLATTAEQIDFAREPGIDSIADIGRRVTLELPADLVEALRAAGLEVEIIERFPQIEISPGERQEDSPAEAGEDRGGPGRACTLYVFGSNTTDVSIPD